MKNKNVAIHAQEERAEKLDTYFLNEEASTKQCDVLNVNIIQRNQNIKTGEIIALSSLVGFVITALALYTDSEDTSAYLKLFITLPTLCFFIVAAAKLSLDGQNSTERRALQSLQSTYSETNKAKATNDLNALNTKIRLLDAEIKNCETKLRRLESLISTLKNKSTRYYTQAQNILPRDTSAHNNLGFFGGPPAPVATPLVLETEQPPAYGSWQ